MTAIHQFVAGFSGGDAISNEARELRALFRSWGFDSEIFSEKRRILPELRKQSRDIQDAPEAIRTDDIVLLHLSIGSVVNDVFARLDCGKAILYHNITPPEYLAGVQPYMAKSLAWGREQLAKLSDTASVVMADSAYNAGELTKLGYTNVQVFPLFLDLNKLQTRPDRRFEKKYGDGLINILFVGRCVPNKRIEDLLNLLYYLQNYVSPDYRLIHAGSYAGLEKYHALLLTRARELGLRQLEMTGNVPQGELNSAYQCADLFVSMSEHEGFCIPLIESMVHDVPVLAYAAGAVPETLDGAGILFHEKNFALLAELIHCIAREDQGLRKQIITGQRDRLSRYTSRNLGNELRQHLKPLLD